MTTPTLPNGLREAELVAQIQIVAARMQHDIAKYGELACDYDSYLKEINTELTAIRSLPAQPSVEQGEWAKRAASKIAGYIFTIKPIPEMADDEVAHIEKIILNHTPPASHPTVQGDTAEERPLTPSQELANKAFRMGIRLDTAEGAVNPGAYEYLSAQYCKLEAKLAAVTWDRDLWKTRALENENEAASLEGRVAALQAENEKLRGDIDKVDKILGRRGHDVLGAASDIQLDVEELRTRLTAHQAWEKQARAALKNLADAAACDAVNARQVGVGDEWEVAMTLLSIPPTGGTGA